MNFAMIERGIEALERIATALETTAEDLTQLRNIVTTPRWVAARDLEDYE